MDDREALTVDVLVAFLGAPQKYDEVTYVLAEQNYLTPYCPEALVNFLKPQRLVLLVTEKARKAMTGNMNNLADLTRRVEQMNCQVVDVPIPDSPFLKEAFDTVLWELFTINTQQIREGERVAFDVTFGYRFLPILTVVVGQFLQFAKGVQMAGIYYGAREAADAQDKTPVMNLTSLTEVMAWTSAAAHFARTGNASPFVQQQDRYLDDSLKQVWEHLEDVSQSLRLGLAAKIGKSVNDLLETLRQISPQGQPATAPLRALFDQIAEKYEPLAIAEPLTLRNAPAHLRQQAMLIEWYVQNGQELHAVLLAREWLITRVMTASRIHDLLIWEKRNETAGILNAAARYKNSDLDEIDSLEKETANLRHVPSQAEIVRLWGICIFARNQLAHMSMDARARSLAELRAAVAELSTGIANLKHLL